MQVYAPLVILASAISAVACLQEHRVSYKSIQSSTGECDLYLPTDAVRKDCGVRCVSLVNRIWNDTAGRLSESISRFYAEGTQSTCARDRTFQCLKQVSTSIPTRNTCKLAEASVDCYRNNYGQLDVVSPRFVPFSDLQQVQILSQCAEMLGVADKMQFVVRNGVDSIPEGACLVRCLLMRKGLYTDRDGPNLDRVSVQCGGYEGYEQEWRTNVTRCVKAVHAEGIHDKCAQAERIAVDCLQMHLHLYEAKNAKAREQIPFGIEFYTNVNANANAEAGATAAARVITYIFLYYTTYW
ncbi:hypothetical protein RP20_CCG013003 [Aedes albopictus]|nr:hypothetical protein RP20_CCG013003 [Aedes albopictus]